MNIKRIINNEVRSFIKEEDKNPWAYKYDSTIPVMGEPLKLKRGEIFDAIDIDTGKRVKVKVLERLLTTLATKLFTIYFVDNNGYLDLLIHEQTDRKGKPIPHDKAYTGWRGDFAKQLASNYYPLNRMKTKVKKIIQKYGLKPEVPVQDFGGSKPIDFTKIGE